MTIQIHLLFHDQDRARVLAGAGALANAVGLTLGPRAEGVLVARRGGGSCLSTEALTIARLVDPGDPGEAAGAHVLRQVAERTVAAVGDGAATAVLLAHGLLAGGLDAVGRGASPLAIKQGIERGTAAAATALRGLSRPVRRREWVQVAVTAAQSDDLLGELVVEACELNGSGEGVRVEEAVAAGRALELVRDEAGQPVLRVASGEAAGARCRVEDVRRAVAAVGAAIAEGAVPGGGLALLRAMPAVERAAAAAPGGERRGVEIVGRALQAPLRRIAESAGIAGDEAVARLAEATGDIGLDARCGRYVDLMKAGIIDPTRVVRVALENAASVAGLLLLTEATVGDGMEVALSGAA